MLPFVRRYISYMGRERFQTPLRCSTESNGAGDEGKRETPALSGHLSLAVNSDTYLSQQTRDSQPTSEQCDLL